MDGRTDGRSVGGTNGCSGTYRRTDGRADGRTGACPVLVWAGCLEDFVTNVGRSAKYLGLKQRPTQYICICMGVVPEGARDQCWQH